MRRRASSRRAIHTLRSLCLHRAGVIVRPGGYAVLFVGPTADVSAVARMAEEVGGGESELRDGLLTIPKVAPTPAGFPRRVGVARKRPLA